MADIGIIGAMEIEVDALCKKLEGHKTESFGGIEFHTGVLFGKSTVIARCGIGKVFAAMCAEAMIVRFSPKLLVNTGVGGAIAEGLETGDIVIADKALQHDMDTSALGDDPGLISGINKIYFESDKRALSLLSEAASALGYPLKVRTVATGDKFIASYEDKKRIAEAFGASVCEMEGGAIAQVAFVNSCPFVIVRAISDSADGSATMDYASFLPIAAKRSAELTMELVKKY